MDMTSRTLATLACAAVLSSCTKSDHSAPAASASARPAAPPSSAPTSGARPSADVVATRAGDLKIIPLHHATFVLEWSGKTVYADPAPDAQYGGLPKADVILITDIHGDHMSPPTVASLKKDGTSV